MAKKQAFGEQAKLLKGAQRKMAKVIIATRTETGSYGYREAMVEQDQALEFIKKNRS